MNHVCRSRYYIYSTSNIEVDVFRKRDFKELIDMKLEKIVPPHLLIEAKWVLYSLIKRGEIKNFDIAIEDFNEGLRFIIHKRVFKIFH